MGPYGALIFYIDHSHRSPYAIEIMTAFTATGLLGYSLLSKPLTLTVDKVELTVKHGEDERAIVRSIQSAKSVVLISDHNDSSDPRRASFRVFIDAKTEVPIATYSNLFAARALAQKIAHYLSVPLDDQSQSSTARHTNREARSAHIAERRTLQDAQPKLLQVTLRSTIVLMLCASILLGIIVKLHGSIHPLAPLAGPAGLVILVVLARVLDRRQ